MCMLVCPLSAYDTVYFVSLSMQFQSYIRILLMTFTINGIAIFS